MLAARACQRRGRPHPLHHCRRRGHTVCANHHDEHPHHDAHSDEEQRFLLLPDQIAKFYDASTCIWVDIWGEHLHHGFYPEGFRGSLQEHKRAQIDMIEEVLKWAEVPEPGSKDAPQTFLDVGCGVGGSSRHLQRKYGGTTQGITLSPDQVRIAEAMSEAAGQSEFCSFQVANALNMPFPDNSFDVVWSLESGEHIPEKEKFMREMHRVCKPGGKVILVTWVHRDLPSSQPQLKRRERALLKMINWAYHLPDWCSISNYVQIAEERLELNAPSIQCADWTKHIKPFWGAVIRTALQPRGWLALYRGGWRTLRGACVMPLMKLGYSMGTIKFGLLTYDKPKVAVAPVKVEKQKQPNHQRHKESNGVKAPAVPAAAAQLRKAESDTGRGLSMPASAAVASAQGSMGSSRRARRRGGLRGWGRAFTMPVRHPGLRAAEATTTEAGSRGFGAGLVAAVSTVWDFSRPHTLIGSFLSVVAVHLFAAAPFLAEHGVAAVLPSTMNSIFLALVPALLVNIYITGLNQLFDVEIDLVNKPYLPIPSGKLTERRGWQICMTCLALAAVWSVIHLRARSLALHLTLVLSTILGTIYSAPPIRLKRFPFFAAFCIVVVRGLVINLGFYWFAMETLLGPGYVSAGLPIIDARSGLSALFFAVFGLVIAFMKDVPDVLGDRMRGIRSLSVRLGPKRVLRISTAILKLLLIATVASFFFYGALAFRRGMPYIGAARALLGGVAGVATKFLATKLRTVDPESSDSVYAFYMDVWLVFYIAYLFLPLAM